MPEANLDPADAQRRCSPRPCPDADNSGVSPAWNGIAPTQNVDSAMGRFKRTAQGAVRRATGEISAYKDALNSLLLHGLAQSQRHQLHMTPPEMPPPAVRHTPPPAAGETPPPPASAWAQAAGGAPATYETRVSAPEMPPPPPASFPRQATAGKLAGVQQITQGAKQRVRRMTEEIKVCTEAFSALLKEASARHGAPEKPVEPSPDSVAGGSSSQADHLYPPGRLGAPRRILRKTALEIQSFRDRLSQLVQESTLRAQERQKLLEPPPAAEPAHEIEKFKYASLCPSKWGTMSGTERCHFCNICGLSVYNFSKMDASEAGKLVFQREGILHAAFYKRADGKFLTRDCPVGLRRRQTQLVALLFSAIWATGLALFVLALRPVPEQTLSQPEEATANLPAAETGSPSQFGTAAPGNQAGFTLPQPGAASALAEEQLDELTADNEQLDEPESDSEPAQAPLDSRAVQLSRSGGEAPPDLR